MTKQPNAAMPDLPRFLQDWTALWTEELQAQAGDPAMLMGAMEMLRGMATLWTSGLLQSGVASGLENASAQFPTPPWPASAAVPPDTRDAEIERLNRRIDVLEARINELTTPKRGTSTLRTKSPRRV